MGTILLYPCASIVGLFYTENHMKKLRYYRPIWNCIVSDWKAGGTCTWL
jgi:hypothetical protein